MSKKKKAKEVGSKFNMWFSAQFGDLPHAQEQAELETKIQRQEAELSANKQRLERLRTLQAQYTAARYAHNAKDSDYDF